MKPLLFIINKFKNKFALLKRHLITWKAIWLDTPVFGNAVQLLYARVTRPFCFFSRGAYKKVGSARLQNHHSRFYCQSHDNYSVMEFPNFIGRIWVVYGLLEFVFNY